MMQKRLPAISIVRQMQTLIAQTSYPYRYEVPTLVQKKAYTGKEKKRYSFWYRNKYIGLYQNGISYRFYDKESEKSNSV